MVAIFVDLRLLTVADYHQMVESGILSADERVELVEGQLYQMAAKGTAHSAAVTRIDRILADRLGDAVLLRFQDPVLLSNVSEPEPDVAVVQPDRLDYEERHPGPGDILLLIEVADTTVKRDLEIKAPAYGRAGVVETWVLDVSGRCLHVFREPGPKGYGLKWVVTDGESIAPLALPNCVIQVREWLRPQFS
jgi:Uma2 family endonuclease